ncbi:MAG: chondroitinase family polysaccharide lyase, partial [Balneolaceae bacterium]
MEIITPGSVTQGTVFIDLFEFASSVPPRSADYQIPFVDSKEDTYYQSQQVSATPVPESIKIQQANEFDEIADRYEKWILGDNLELENLDPITQIRYDALLSSITNALTKYDNLNITVNGKNVTGAPLFMNGSGYTSSGPTFVSVFNDIILQLAMDYRLHGNLNSRDRFMTLIDHVHDQGLAEGSALGTLYYGTNSFSGYGPAVFLMRDVLRQEGQLQHALSAMKWYAQAGETYVIPEIISTSAGRIRSLNMVRLARILCMDNSSEKVSEMQDFLRWTDNSLGIALSRAGIIKSDYVGFQHGGIYASAYAPHAMHAGSFLAYLLRGTEFTLS